MQDVQDICSKKCHDKSEETRAPSEYETSVLKNDCHESQQGYVKIITSICQERSGENSYDTVKLVQCTDNYKTAEITDYLAICNKDDEGQPSNNLMINNVMDSLNGEKLGGRSGVDDDYLQPIDVNTIPAAGVIYLHSTNNDILRDDDYSSTQEYADEKAAQATVANTIYDCNSVSMLH